MVVMDFLVILFDNEIKINDVYYVGIINHRMIHIQWQIQWFVYT